MSISEMESELEANPGLSVIGGATPQLDPWRLGRKKPDDGFREVLGKMKRFYKNHTITE